MLKCLENLNFGDSFISWVKLFYNDISSVVLNNGHLSDAFSIRRGVRQGCPLSSLLFIICIEFLANYLNKESSIKGININGIEIKQTLFADDATFLNNGEQNSFKKLIDVITNFEYVSGLKLNFSKSTILRIGTLANTNISYCKEKHFKWTSESANTLGMIFTNDIDKNISLNLEPKLNSFKNCLKQWEHRKLSLLGKITVIKTFALPKLIYPFTVLPNPSEDTLQKLIKEMFLFIWNKKPEKIKRETMKLDYREGGLKMLDLKCFLNSIKACWVKRFLCNKGSVLWDTFYDKNLQNFGGKILFESEIDDKDIKNIFRKNTFLKDILIAWHKIKRCKPCLTIGKQLLWNNSNIRSGDFVLYYKTWYEKGIKYIEQLYDFRNKEFYSFEHFKYLYNFEDSESFRFLKMIASIKPMLKRSLMNESITYSAPESLKNDVLKSKSPNKLLYTKQLNIKTKPEIKSETKWKYLLNNSDIKWTLVYIQTFKSTIDTRIRNFQYKYIMRIIPTNKYLFKMKISNTNLCDFCCMHVETIEHLFWECHHAQILWNRLSHFLYSKGLYVRFNIENVSFGIMQKSLKDNVINFVIYLMKFFILQMKNKETIPAFDHFLSYLKIRISLEKEISIMQNKVEYHSRK